jgi:hypothetical protein
VGAVVFSAAVVEFALRAFYAQHVNLFPRYATAARYGEFVVRQNVPNIRYWHTSVDGCWEFTINNRGFRDREDVGYEKPAGVFRILVLGDSQTLGFEVRQEYTFPAVLERYLTARGWSAQALNAGVAGFGTTEQLVFLREEGLRYQPDAVVLAFYQNDYDDNIKADLYRIEDARLVLNKSRHTPGVRALDLVNRFGILRYLSEHSLAYSLAFNTMWNSAKRLLHRTQLERVAEGAALVDAGGVSVYRKTLALALLSEVRRITRERDIPLILVDIPAFRQANIDERHPMISPSLPEEVRRGGQRFADKILGIELLEPYVGVVELFVPHGQRHISEFAHFLIGTRLAETIEGL